MGQSANQDRTIRALYVGIVCVTAVALAAMYWQSHSPREIKVHVTPSFHAGETIVVRNGISPVPPANVYSFGYYMWQGLNRWVADGAKDYGRQLFAYQHFLTPACQEQLTVDLDRRAKAGELAGRTRSMNEIPGQAFSISRVVTESDNAWLVLLDVQLTETVRGVAVKDTYLRYPLRVVRYDVDREKNPWGLAIDCFGGNKPERLDPAVVVAGQARLAMTAPAPAPLPAAIALPVAAPNQAPVQAAVHESNNPAAAAAQHPSAPRGAAQETRP